MRSILAAITGLMIFGCASITWASEVKIGDDGLHKPDWFSLTFKDIPEDIVAAKEQGKRLALIIEQRGCIYCKEVHENILTDLEVRDFIKEHYMVVQYNLHGAEEIVDTDGETLTEKWQAGNGECCLPQRSCLCRKILRKTAWTQQVQRLQ